MTDSIIQLDNQFDPNKLIAATFKVAQMVDWTENNQIALSSQGGFSDDYPTHLLAHGDATLRSMEDGVMVRDDSWFDTFIHGFENTYFYDIWKELKAEYENVYRMRLMKLEHKGCLSFHHDFYKRHHIPILTNDSSFFFINETDEEPWITDDIAVPSVVTYHLPAKGNMYLVDTTKRHTVYNGGLSNRIHLVVSIK